MRKTVLKKSLLIIAIALILAALAVTLSSCDGGSAFDDAMARKLSEITENCVLSGVGNNEEIVSAYDAYLAYFRIYPEKFDRFYAEKKEEIKNNELGKCSLYAPKIDFEAAMPDGTSVEFYYNFITKRIHSSSSVWNDYEYRYYDIEGIYTEPEGGALVIDGDMNNVSGLAPESFVDSKFYVRLQPTTVKVKLDTDGGELSLGNEFTMRLGEDILPYLNELPEKRGYDFVGWKFTVGDKDAYPLAVIDFTSVPNESLRIMNEVNFLLKNARDEAGYNIMITGKYEGYYSTDFYVTMTAQYKPKKHTVTYMDFNGGVFKTAEYDEGTVLTQYNTERLSVYSCKGWSMTEGSDQLFDTFTLSGDLTLYPVRAREKTVNLYFSNGTVATCTVYETYPLILSDILSSGYGIEDWYLDEAHTIQVETDVIPFSQLADAYYAVIYPH